MKKTILILIAGFCLLMFVAGCIPEAADYKEDATEAEETEETEQQEQETEKQETETKPAEPSEESEPVVKVTEKKETACGDAKCSEEETCYNCPEDCGDCPLELFNAVCERDANDYNVKITLKNANPYPVKVKAYPKAIFSNLGVFEGQVKELSVDPYGVRHYTYSFYPGGETDEVTVKIFSGEKAITNIKSAECINE